MHQDLTMLRPGIAMIWTDVFQKNDIIVNKFSKIMRIFDKIDRSEDQGVI